MDDKYEVLHLVGEGGMGAVYVARHLQIGKKVAIKLLHPELARSAEVVHRFMQEARAAAAVGHPGIIDIHDIGHAPDGAPYLVMELLEGESLRAAIEREGRLSIGFCTWVGAHVLSALEAAHRKGIVHRDIKPDNVFLERGVGRLPNVKLLDFGISKMAEAGREFATRTGMSMGTPYYMAPEQARGDANLDRRVDIYAMGVILYEALTGKLPLDAPNYNAMIVKIVSEQPRTPGSIRPDLPAELEAVVLKALAKDPDHRYQRAIDLAEAISRWATGPLPVDPSAEPGSNAFATTLRGSAPPPAVAAPSTGRKAPADVPTPYAVESQPPPRPRGRRWIWAAVAGAALVVVTVIGATRAWEPPVAPSVPVPPILPAPTLVTSAPPVRPASPVETNQWIRIAAPPAPVELGLDGPDAEDAVGLLGLRRGADVFSGPAFEIQQHEVTWRELYAHTAPDPHPSLARIPPAPDAGLLPAAGIEYSLAESFCKGIDPNGDLPSESEWEYAARGAIGRLHPWGGDPIDLDRVHAYRGTGGAPAVVMTRPADRTSDGVFDLAGNVAEWTRSKFRIRDGTMKPWGYSYRAGRGLPLLGDPPAPGHLPPSSATFRRRFCDGDGCDAEEAARLRREIGFRCVRHR